MAAAGGPVPVVTAHAVSKAVPVTIPAVGTAEPLATVQIRAQVTGQLSAIHFVEGQDVKKGAPLFTLDARPFEAALQQAQAVLARDTAQAKNAQAQRARYDDLFKRGLIARDQYETQIANANALESTLAADQAQIENARLNLQYTKIAAPISGRTGVLNVHQGDLVRANDTTPLVVINQVAPIYVTFSVPGRFLPDIRRYQSQQALKIEARIQSGGTPGAQQVAPPNPGNAPATDGNDGASSAAPPAAPSTLTIEAGTVSFIDNSVDPTTGTIRMKGTFANADHALWPGLFVQVNSILRHRSQRDRRALGRSPDVTVGTVRLRREAGRSDGGGAKRHRGAAAGDESIISHGLRPGEEVVTDGQLRLNPGLESPRAPEGTARAAGRRSRRIGMTREAGAAADAEAGIEEISHEFR